MNQSYWFIISIIIILLIYFSYYSRSDGFKKKIRRSTTGYYIQSYGNKELYYKNKRIHSILSGRPHFPRLISSNDNILELTISNVGRNLQNNDHIPDLYQQISEIKQTLNELNIIHGDVHLSNLTVKNGQIYLLDFEHSHSPPYQHQLTFACYDVPSAISEDTWSSYLHRNPCLLAYIPQTEVHYVILWGPEKELAKERVLSSLLQYNYSLLGDITLDLETAKSLLKNVSSGGKQTMEKNINILFVEVPSDYEEKPTYNNPKGELVNSAMWNIKINGRGDYTNYKIMHGSFNKRESKEFMKDYFKFLGPFSDNREIIKTLNAGNIWWLYDRVDPQNFDEKDIDLVVSSLPASNFYLRTIGEGYKSYINIGNNIILCDLQDLNSYYYPRKWLRDIMNDPLDRYNDIPIAQPLDRLMLGLYHYHIHKNGDQKFLSLDRKNIINKLAFMLNIDDPYSIQVIKQFLHTNMYNARCCIDSKVGCNINF